MNGAGSSSKEPVGGRHIVMRAEGSDMSMRGGEVRAILGATYTGRSIDIEGGYAAAKAWFEAVIRQRDETAWSTRFESAVAQAHLAAGPEEFFRGRVLDA